MTYPELTQAIFDYCVANGVTLAQLKNITQQQVFTALGIGNSTAEDIATRRRIVGGWESLKGWVRRKREEEFEKAELDSLKAVAATWLTANFPSATWRRDGDVITIFLNGEPN